MPVYKIERTGIPVLESFHKASRSKVFANLHKSKIWKFITTQT